MAWVRFAALIALAALAGCTDEYIWNQKVTVRVETPGGVRTGSSVQRVTVTHQTNDTIVGLQNGHAVSSGLRGEAVVMDVRPDAAPDEPRYLFMLLDNAKALAHETVPGIERTSTGEIYSKVERAAEPYRIPRDAYPLMVTFRDMTDPTSVVRIEPDQLAATFGPGVRLAGVTLEVVDEDVTKGRVEAVLPWLKDIEGGYLHGGTTSKGAPFGLTGLAFYRGQ